MPKTEKHPAIFVFNGSIRHYEDGSILELHTQVTAEEWYQITEETIKYKIFLDCLKTVAFPALDEQWTETDEWFRLQLGVAVSRIRNIDPLLCAKHNQAELEAAYTAQMQDNSKAVTEQIASLREMANNAEIRVVGL